MQRDTKMRKIKLLDDLEVDPGTIIVSTIDPRKKAIVLDNRNIWFEEKVTTVSAVATRLANKRNVLRGPDYWKVEGDDRTLTQRRLQIMKEKEQNMRKNIYEELRNSDEVFERFFDYMVKNHTDKMIELLEKKIRSDPNAEGFCAQEYEEFLKEEEELTVLAEIDRRRQEMKEEEVIAEIERKENA